MRLATYRLFGYVTNNTLTKVIENNLDCNTSTLLCFYHKAYDIISRSLMSCIRYK